jgi:hypothetical protein
MARGRKGRRNEKEANFKRTDKRKQGDTYVKKNGYFFTEKFQDTERSVEERDMDTYTLKGRKEVVFLSLSISEQLKEHTYLF